MGTCPTCGAAVTDESWASFREELGILPTDARLLAERVAALETVCQKSGEVLQALANQSVDQTARLEHVEKLTTHVAQAVLGLGQMLSGLARRMGVG